MPFKYKCYIAVLAILAVGLPVIGLMPFGDKVKAWAGTAFVAIVFLSAFALLAFDGRRKFLKSQSDRD